MNSCLPAILRAQSRDQEDDHLQALCRPCRDSLIPRLLSRHCRAWLSLSAASRLELRRSIIHPLKLSSFARLDSRGGCPYTIHLLSDSRATAPIRCSLLYEFQHRAPELVTRILERRVVLDVV